MPTQAKKKFDEIQQGILQGMVDEYKDASPERQEELRPKIQAFGGSVEDSPIKDEILANLDFATSTAFCRSSQGQRFSCIDLPPSSSLSVLKMS